MRKFFFADAAVAFTLLNIFYVVVGAVAFKRIHTYTRTQEQKLNTHALAFAPANTKHALAPVCFKCAHVHNVAESRCRGIGCAKCYTVSSRTPSSVRCALSDMLAARATLARRHEDEAGVAAAAAAAAYGYSRLSALARMQNETRRRRCRAMSFFVSTAPFFSPRSPANRARKRRLRALASHVRVDLY